MTRAISHIAPEPAQWGPADVLAGAIIIACAIGLVAGAAILRERSTGSGLACIVLAGAMYAWRLW